MDGLELRAEAVIGGRGERHGYSKRKELSERKGREAHTGTEDSVLKALGRQIWYLRLLWQLRLWDAEPDSSSSSF